MTDNNPTDMTHYQEDSIDIITHLKTVWEGRKLVLMGVAVFSIFGCIVALSSPVIYTSETTFVPQTSDDSMSSSTKGLGSLAGLVGIDLSSVSSSKDSYLSPLLYSKISDSEEFSINLLSEQLINLEGETFTVKDYLMKDSGGFNLIGFIKKYTIALFSSKSS